MTSDHVSCLAIVLKTTPYGESDLCVELFTQQIGRARVMAKGALKSTRRYMGTLELGALIKVDFRPKLYSLPTLGPCDVISSPWKARTELSRLATLYYLLELVIRSIPLDDPDEGLFQSLVELLQLLESAEGLTQSELLSWELSLLDRLGYHLRIERCPYTGLAPNALSLKEGGAVHTSSVRSCSPVPTSALRTLYRLQHHRHLNPSIHFNHEELKALRFAFSSLWADVCGTPLKSFAFLSQVLSLETPSESSTVPITSPVAISPLNALQNSMISLILLLLVIATIGCTQIPQGIQDALSNDDELVVEELEEVIHRQGESAQITVQSRAQLKEGLKHSLKLARECTVTAALNAEFKPLKDPFEPDELTPYIQDLEEHGRIIALRFQSAHGLLTCALSPSTLSAQVLRMIQAQSGSLSISTSQPRLWLGFDIKPFKNKELNTLQNDPNHPIFYPLPAPPIRSLSTQGGDWVAISGKEVIEALILEGPTPWLPSTSHLIGRCERGTTLKSLTRLNIIDDRQLYPDLKLILTQLGWVSREVPSSP